MYPVIVQIGNFQLGSYTLMAAIGAAVFFILLRRYFIQMGLRRDEEYWLLVNVIAISAFLGAKAFYLIFSFPGSLNSISRPVFSINSGFSASGFFFGLICGVWIFSLKLKLDFFRIMDRICIVLPFWQALGKAGCFLHGCCYGIPAPSGLPWSVKFSSQLSGVPDMLLGIALHPVQLYESGADFFLGLSLILISKKIDSVKYRRGLILALYLIFYGIIRFSLDFFRASNGFHGAGSISGHVIAGLLILSGVLMLILRRD